MYQKNPDVGAFRTRVLRAEERRGEYSYWPMPPATVS
jgi:hypothetical protein